jgi:predicted permease
MITSGVLAEQHKLAPPVATAVVGLGTLLALISVPAWHCLLVWIG